MRKKFRVVAASGKKINVERIRLIQSIFPRCTVELRTYRSKDHTIWADLLSHRIVEWEDYPD